MPEPVAVRLAAPPPQHLTASGAVHAPLLVIAPHARPAARTPKTSSPVTGLVTRSLPRALTLSPSKPLTVPRLPAAPRRPQAPIVKAPVTAPVAVPAATPVQEPVRVLAAVPLTPVDSTPATTTVSTATSSGSTAAARHGNGNGHAYGHLKHAQAAAVASTPPAAVPATPEPLTPVSQPAPVVELTSTAPDSLDAGDADCDKVVHGHGFGRGNGKGHRG